VESTCKTVAPSSAALEPGFIMGKDEAALLRRCGRSAAKSSPRNWPEIPHRPTRPRYRKTYPALVTRQYRAGHHKCPTVAPPSDLPVDGRDPPWPGRRQRCGIRIQVHAAMVVSEEAAAEKYMPQLQHNMWVVAARTAVLSVITASGSRSRPTRCIRSFFCHDLSANTSIADRGDVGAEEKIRFTSSILPKWARRTKSLDALRRPARRPRHAHLSATDFDRSHPGLDCSMWPMAMTHDAVAAIRQFQVLPHGDKGVGFRDQHLGQHAAGALQVKPDYYCSTRWSARTPGLPARGMLTFAQLLDRPLVHLGSDQSNMLGEK
jgi:hypothetical protein